MIYGPGQYLRIKQEMRLGLIMQKDPCPVCGEAIQGENKVYCSKYCQRRRKNNSHQKQAK